MAIDNNKEGKKNLNEFLNQIGGLEYNKELIAKRNLSYLARQGFDVEKEPSEFVSNIATRLFRKISKGEARELFTLWYRKDENISGVKRENRVYMPLLTDEVLLELTKKLVSENLVPPSLIREFDFLEMVGAFHGFDVGDKKMSAEFFDRNNELVILKNAIRVEDISVKFRREQAEAFIRRIRGHFRAHPNINLLVVRSELPFVGEQDKSLWLSFLGKSFEIEVDKENI